MWGRKECRKVDDEPKSNFKDPECCPLNYYCLIKSVLYRANIQIENIPTYKTCIRDTENSLRNEISITQKFLQITCEQEGKDPS